MYEVRLKSEDGITIYSTVIQANSVAELLVEIVRIFSVTLGMTMPAGQIHWNKK